MSAKPTINYFVAIQDELIEWCIDSFDKNAKVYGAKGGTYILQERYINEVSKREITPQVLKTLADIERLRSTLLRVLPRYDHRGKRKIKDKYSDVETGLGNRIKTIYHNRSKANK